MAKQHEPTIGYDYTDVTKSGVYVSGGGTIADHDRTARDGQYIGQSTIKCNLIPTSNNIGGIYLTRHTYTDTTITKCLYDYKFNFYRWSGSLTYYSETWNKSTDTTTNTSNTRTYNNATDAFSVGDNNSNYVDGRYWIFSTNLPIFDENDTQSINKYKESGDTSGAINHDYLGIEKVISNIYVDQSQPPNLKFTWNIDGGEPPTDYKIEIHGGGADNMGLIADIESSGSYSTTWGLLEAKSIKGLPSITCMLSYNNYTDEIQVVINKDGTFSPTSAHIGKHYLNVSRGSGENDDGYQDTEDESNARDDNVTVNICDLLTNTYKVTETQLKAVGNFLWASNFFDNIKLVNNNPIENIISCKALPISADGTTTTISMGNVNSGVGGIAVDTNYFKKTIGSVYVPRIYNNFVDFEHCQITLYLPLIGIITDLSPSEVVGYEITLKYCFDLITGDCLAMIFNNRGGGENCIGTYKGNCGVDIPLTASNRAQVQAGYISDFVGGIASIATKDIGGVVNSGLGALTRQYTNHSSGSVSGVTAQGLPKQAYLTLVENATQIPSNYAQTYGRPCNLTKKLKDLSGFTVCDNNIRVSNIVCTEEEQEEIRDLLTKGVIL